MKTLRSGERIWQAFVHVSLAQVLPEVRPMRILRRVNDEHVEVIDERTGCVRLVEESSVCNVYCDSEAEAWNACEIGLRRVAQQCIEHAAKCNARKVVSHVVA